MKSVYQAIGKQAALWAFCFMTTASVSWGQPTPVPTAQPATDNSGITTYAPEQVFDQAYSDQAYEPIIAESLPTWKVSVGSVFLNRARGDKTTLVRAGNFALGGASLLDARSFDFDHRFGLNVEATRHMESFDLHFNAFQVSGWNDAVGFVGPLGTFSSTFPAALNSFDTFSNFLYSSEFASAEINVKARTDSAITPFVGFRWVQLNEKLVGSNDAFPGIGGTGLTTPLFSSDTQNDLFGLQVGADVLIYESERFEFTGTGKFALAGNAARNELTTSQALINANPVGTFNPRVGSASTKLAFIYDFGLKGKVKVTDNVAFTAGYNVIILSKLALAPGQLERNQLIIPVPAAPLSPPGTTSLDTGDVLIIHGGQLNLEVTW